MVQQEHRHLPFHRACVLTHSQDPPESTGKQEQGRKACRPDPVGQWPTAGAGHFPDHHLHGEGLPLLLGAWEGACFTREPCQARAQEAPSASVGRGQGTPTPDRLRVYARGTGELGGSPDPKDCLPAGGRKPWVMGTRGRHKTCLSMHRPSNLLSTDHLTREASLSTRQTRTRELRGLKSTEPPKRRQGQVRRKGSCRNPNVDTVLSPRSLRKENTDTSKCGKKQNQIKTRRRDTKSWGGRETCRE